MPAGKLHCTEKAAVQNLWKQGGKPFSNVRPYESKVKADDLLEASSRGVKASWRWSLLLGMAASFVSGMKQIPASRAEHVALQIAVNADPQNRF